MNKAIIRALYKKEILDILRDKKTLLMMIMVPLILYPVLFIGASALTASILTADTNNSYRIMCTELAKEYNIQEFIGMHENEFDYDFIFITDLNIENPKTGEKNLLSPDEALKNKNIDAYLSGKIVDGKECYYINYCSSENDSSTAASMLNEMMNLYKEYTRVALVEGQDLDKNEILYSISVSRNDISSSEETVGSLFGYIIPFMLITSILMGAMYPAIDLTAGEKERGTLETLLTLPVNNMELIISKFLATTTIAASAALLNVVSMGFIAVYFYSTLSLSADASNEIIQNFSVSAFIPAILITLLVSLVFSMFCSAICLFVCIFSKSFKEAQNYSTPVMIIFMFSAIASVIPGIELNTMTSVIPIVNISLLIDQLFMLHFDMKMITSVIASNVSYCALAVIVMARIFSSENVLFGESTDGIRLIEKRRDMKKGELPGVGDLMLLFSVLLIILLLPGSLLILKYGIFGMIMQQLIIGGLTLFYCWYIKTDFKKLFSFKAPSIKAFVSGTLLWAGSYLPLIFLSSLIGRIFPRSLEGSGDMLSELWAGQPFLLILFATALIPAICEELAFRGFLLGTLKGKFSGVVSIIFTGLFFGLYHMNVIKFFVVGILGIILSYVVYKSESIFVSMWMHFLNNAVAVVIALKPEFVQKYIPWANDLNFGNMIIITLVSVLLFAVGFLMMKFTVNSRNKDAT